MPEKFLTTHPRGYRALASRLLLGLIAFVLLLSLMQFASAVLETAGTLPHVHWAERLNPFNHHPHLLLAELEPHSAPAHWRQIRTLHPLYAPAWIRLSLDQEMQGFTSDAEGALRHAASLDHTFLPQWTLANFYFRQRREDLFWSHARKAAAVYQGDLTGVFQLSLRIEEDPLRVWNLLSPPRPSARMDLMRVLLSQGRTTAAARVAGPLASSQLRGTRELLLIACEQALARNEVPAAISFWNAAAANGWIARPTLDIDKGNLLADSAFQYQPTGTCFDWRLPSQPGVSLRTGAPAGLRIGLTGRQSAETVLATVRVPVAPRRRYRLTWRYTIELGSNASRPVWRLDGKPAAFWQTAVSSREESFDFDAGSRQLIELSLATAPAPGATRPEGRIRLDWVSITVIP